MLAYHFLREYSISEGKPFQGLTAAAEAAICRYPWPGNVRQLQNAIHQVVVLNDGPTVEKSMLPVPIASGHLNTEEEPTAVGHTKTTIVNVSSSQDNMAPHIAKRQRVIPLWLIEKNAIEGAIEACGGNVNQAAGLLEVAPSTIYRKLQNWKKISA